MTGLLKVKGTLDLNQFWPDGESDADTAKVKVGQNAFSFQTHPGAPFKVTHVFDNASVRGKTGTKAAIKNQQITIRFQGIDATELHYRPEPLPSATSSAGKAISKARRSKYSALTHEYRQFQAETSTAALHNFLNPAAVSARLMMPLTSKPRRGLAGSGRRTGVVRGHSVLERSGPCSVTGATAGKGFARSLAAKLSTFFALASACALV